ncbi:MAG: DUF6268 family outer membrane beta-barrel protein [Pirellulales bacterium]
MLSRYVHLLIVATLLLLTAQDTFAQHTRLPEVIPPQPPSANWPPSSQVQPLPPQQEMLQFDPSLQYAQPADETLPIYVESYQPPPSSSPAGRDGVFQHVDFAGTWLAGSGPGELGMSDLELSALFGFPFPARESPLLVTPRFGIHYFDGPVSSGSPSSADLPPQVYDASLQFRHLRDFAGPWAMDIAVQPGVYSDFEDAGSDALRITGHGLAIYEWSPATKLVLGVAYLDREDVAVLPAGGILWIPHDAVRFELVAPRPRIAWRVDSFTQPHEMWWAYVAGEFGGGEWEVQRAAGDRDVATLRDYRAILGLERQVTGGLSTRMEVGYVFGRDLEYRSGRGDFAPDDTILLRVGARY